MMTTAQMDGWTGDPDDPERHQVHVQCRLDRSWTLLENAEALKTAKCAHCGGNKFDLQSMTSHRTFDAIRAKNRKIRS